MAQVVIENPILNSPFHEPRRHFRFSYEGITDEIVEARRVSSYFMPIPASKKSAQPVIDTEWTKDLVPPELMTDLHRAKIVITNFHAFKSREHTAATKLGKHLFTATKSSRSTSSRSWDENWSCCPTERLKSGRRFKPKTSSSSGG